VTRGAVETIRIGSFKATSRKGKLLLTGDIALLRAEVHLVVTAPDGTRLE
jgi:hypothetical protein